LQRELLVFQESVLLHFGLFEHRVDLRSMREYSQSLRGRARNRRFVFADVLEIEEQFSWYAENVLLMDPRYHDYQYLLSSFSDALRSELLPYVYRTPYVSYRTKSLRREYFDQLFYRNGRKTSLFFGLNRHYDLLKRFFLQNDKLIASIEFPAIPAAKQLNLLKLLYFV